MIFDMSSSYPFKSQLITSKRVNTSSIQTENLLAGGASKQQHFVCRPRERLLKHTRTHTKPTRKRLAKNKQGSFVLCKQYRRMQQA